MTEPPRDPGTNRTDGGWMPHGPMYTAVGILGAAGLAVQGSGRSGTLNVAAGSGAANLVAMGIGGATVLVAVLGLLQVVRAGRRAMPDRARSDATRRMLG